MMNGATPIFRASTVVWAPRQNEPDPPTSSSGTIESSTSSTTSDPPTSQSSSTTHPNPSTSTSTPSESTSKPPEVTSSSTSPSSAPPDTTSIISTPTTTSATTAENTSTRAPDPPPATTTPPPAPVPSITLTSSVTTIITTKDGQLTTFTSAFPTSLSSSVPSKSNSNRTAIIAGATTAGIVLILIALGAVFLYRRHQIRQQFDAYFHRPKREGRGLLDGEDFDDEDGDGVPMRRYRDASGTSTITPRSITPHSQSHSPAPSLYRARGLESGSVFREEVWPPPGRESQLVDPFTDSVRRSREVNLGSIVDDVMGPKVVAAEGVVTGHPPRSENSTAASSSSTGYTGLPGALNRPQSSESMYTDPFRDASRSSPPTSVYYALPPGASPAVTPGAAESSTTAAPPSSYHLQPPPESHLAPASGTTQPKASSPLARAVSSASSKLNIGATESKLWLDRKVRGITEGEQS